MNIMKSIKGKITLWYMLIVVLVLAVALVGAFLASENYSKDEMKTELIDEVGDLEEDMKNYSEYFPGTDLIAYYDDGIMLSVYDAKGEYINGILPDDFPIDHPFMKTEIQEVGNDIDSWYVYDKVMIWEDGQVYWIRGINTYSAITHLVETLTKWILLIFPILVFFTAFMGYRMISKSLKPVQEMAATVNEIKKSSDLSLRIPEHETKDELAYLANTFNDLLATTEDQIQREKQFSSDAAHELRTPISVITAHCEYLLEDMNLDDEIREEIQIVYDKGVHMSDLVDNLLMITRTEKRNYKINMDEIDLSMLADSVVEDMSLQAAEKNIRLHLIDELESPDYTGDMTLMIRLFTNLISNGIKYGKPDGQVVVHMHEDHGLIHVTFDDNGTGIPKDSLDRIWDRFYQVESSRTETSGFGLGLFMVKRIVQLHKGHIDVYSNFGEGSRFVVTLPRLSKLEEE